VVRYRVDGARIEPFTNNTSTLWMSQSRVRWEQLVIEQSSNVPLYWKTDHPELFKATASNDGKHLRLELTRPLYYRALEERGDFMLRDLPRIDISTTNSWQDFLSPIARGFGGLLKDGLPPKAERTSTTVAGLSEEQRVARVLDDVRQRIRYMGDWRETVRGYVPFSLNEIEARGFGDCKDMALTTAALLRKAGIPANVAIVRASLDDRKPLLPTLEYLNHAIVRAKVGGKMVWLDPTSAANSLSAPLDYLQNQVAFVLKDDGGVEEQLIPSQDAARDRVVEQIDYVPDGSNWTVKADIRRNGVPAANLVRTEKQSKNQDELLARDLVPGFATILDRTVTRNAEASALIDSYPISVNARASRLTRQIGSYQLFDMRYLVGTISALREYQAKEGTSDYHLGAASSTRTVRIHDRQALEPVLACHVSSPWIDLTLEPVTVENGVGLAAALTKKTAWISATDMKTPEFARTVDELESCANNTQFLLTKR
jgi:transglutaminase-like putative cysteine protease